VAVKAERIEPVFKWIYGGGVISFSVIHYTTESASVAISQRHPNNDKNHNCSDTAASQFISAVGRNQSSEKIIHKVWVFDSLLKLSGIMLNPLGSTEFPPQAFLPFAGTTPAGALANTGGNAVPITSGEILFYNNFSVLVPAFCNFIPSKNELRFPRDHRNILPAARILLPSRAQTLPRPQVVRR